MKYITEELPGIEENFPFYIYQGKRFTLDDYQNGRAWMHNHRCLEINFARNGGGTYYISDDRYPIRTNDIFILNNLEYHMAINESGDMELMVIIFDADLVWQNSEMDYLYIRAFYESKGAFKNRLRGSDFATPDVVAILDEIQKEWDEQNTGYKLIIKSLLLKLLAVLYRKLESAGKYSNEVLKFQNSYNRLIDAVSYIDQNFREQISSEKLAQMVHMNKNYFSSYFKSTMGRTVSEYIIMRRLKNACLLLSTTDQSIIAVAIDSGFKNVTYFNRTFKEYYGITPTEYRKHIKSV